MKNIFSISLAMLVLHYSVSAQVVAMSLDASSPRQMISRHIYGHFSEHLGRCIYDGFWVNDTMKVRKQDRIRMDVVEALRKIQIPNLRWPGGCFADEYHWRDGVGPRKQRPTMVNTNWGGVSEDNSFGTHEFLELCSLLHCEPYIAGNVGSGTVEEMAKWVEYLNFDGISPMANLRSKNGHPKPWKVTFWGVGNESWGCGGNMTPEYYADEFKRYATYARNYSGTVLNKIASGSYDYDTNWTEVLMKKVGRQMWGLTLHHYTIPTGSWQKKGSATHFDEKEYINTMKNCLALDEMITKHSAVMDKYDSAKKVALVVDEWGIWTDVEPGTNPGFLYQQNSLRDALVAASTLNIFNNHSDRVRMANLAQTINVLQAVILTRGNQILLTPTYHVFDLFKVHQDAKYIPLKFDSPDYRVGDRVIPALNASASKDSNGVVHITLVNLNPNQSIKINTSVTGIQLQNIRGEVLTSEALTDINTFEDPRKVKIEKFNAFSTQGNNLTIDVPSKSVVMLEIK
jgi:alpha-N-arabinofuranosidase